MKEVQKKTGRQPDKALEHTVQRLYVDRCASDGSGMARLNGMAVFVAGGLPGEECDVFLDKIGRSAAWGHAVQIIQPSTSRQPPDCPYFQACGGCRLRHMTYDAELSYKRQWVNDALQRIGGIDLSVSAVHGAAQPNRYRNKAQLPVAIGPKIGFYQARSHQVVDVEDCLLQSQAAARLCRAVKEWMAQYQISAYQERAGTGLIRHVYIRTNRAGQSLCCLMANGGRLPHESALVEALRTAEPNCIGVILGINEKRNNVILGDSYRTLWGKDFLLDTLCGLTFQLSVPSFYQVNPDQAEILYGRALDFAALTGRETVLDLYCGIGTISLVLAQKAAWVIGVEVIPEAVADAQKNAERNGIKNAAFFCADAAQAAQQFTQSGTAPDVICVDPPRKGLSPDTIRLAAQMNPDRIVYVSCDPATLARDLRHFAALGYPAQRAEAVDMFPRTPHVECVVLMSRMVK